MASTSFLRDLRFSIRSDLLCKFTAKRTCSIAPNAYGSSSLCVCWLFKTFRAAFLILWHTPRIAMQNSRAANPYPNDCIAVFIFIPLFWPLLPMNSTE